MPSTWSLHLLNKGSDDVDERRAGEIVAALGRPVEESGPGQWTVTYVNLNRVGDPAVETQADAVELLRSELDAVDGDWDEFLAISAPSTA